MFKAGDKVKCIDASCVATLVKGYTYEVQGVTQQGELLYLVGKGNGYGMWHYGAHRFVLKERNHMNPETVTINEKAKPKTKGLRPQADTYYVQRLGGNAPTVVHLTFDDAKNEANRLAALHPSAEFYVLAKVYSIKKVPVYTSEAQEYSV